MSTRSGEGAPAESRRNDPGRSTSYRRSPLYCASVPASIDRRGVNVCVRRMPSEFASSLDSFSNTRRAMLSFCQVLKAVNTRPAVTCSSDLALHRDQVRLVKY